MHICTPDPVTMVVNGNSFTDFTRIELNFLARETK